MGWNEQSLHDSGTVFFLIFVFCFDIPTYVLIRTTDINTGVKFLLLSRGSQQRRRYDEETDEKWRQPDLILMLCSRQRVKDNALLLVLEATVTSLDVNSHFFCDRWRLDQVFLNNIGAVGRKCEDKPILACIDFR